MKEQTLDAARRRLYERILSEVADVLSAIEDLLNGDSCAFLSGEDFKKRFAEACVCGVFIKRHANLMLLAMENTHLSYGDFSLSVKEMLDTYALTGHVTNLQAASFLPDTGHAQDAGKVFIAYRAFYEALTHKTHAEGKERIPESAQTADETQANVPAPPLNAVEASCVMSVKQEIHAAMGQLLVASRAYLLSDTDDLKERRVLLDNWQKVITHLRTGTHEKKLPDVQKQLLDAANAAGIRLIFSPALPDTEDALKDYTKAASAKIVEAVKAGKDTLTI